MVTGPLTARVQMLRVFVWLVGLAWAAACRAWMSSIILLNGFSEHC